MSVTQTVVAMSVAHTATVSVVVPTTLRRDIHEALNSAREQTQAVEIVLAVDADHDTLIPPAVASLCDVIVFTGGRRGAAFARNLGVARSSGEWIAYLDDDDAWHPRKTEHQLSVARTQPEPKNVIVSCRVRQRSTDSNRLSEPVPAHTYVADGPVGDYLFLDRGPRVDRNSVFLPTLLVHNDLARRIPWDAKLARHQDWDWLLRAMSEGARLIQLGAVLATVTVGSADSISATADWATSLAWARAHRHLLSEPAYRDFLAGQPLRFAVLARDWTGIRQVILELRGAGIPSARSVCLGLTGIVPRPLLQKLAFSFSAIKQTAASTRRRGTRSKTQPPSTLRTQRDAERQPR